MGPEQVLSGIEQAAKPLARQHQAEKQIASAQHATSVKQTTADPWGRRGRDQSNEHVLSQYRTGAKPPNPRKILASAKDKRLK